MKIILSIITPNYNYAQYIGTLIESVLNQRFDNFEHIIVDDGSTDNSVEIISQYVSKYPGKIKLVEQKNHGQSAAINVGLKLAKGEIIGWINSDDTYCENTFNKVVDKFEKNPKSSIVFGDMNALDQDGNFIYRRRHTNFNYVTGCMLGFATILSSNAVFWKSSVLKKNDLFNETLICNMDGDYYSRITNGERILRIKSPLANFRKQPFTKAAENNTNWNKVVRNELLYELKNSYMRLYISKIIPFSWSYPFKFLFRAFRIVIRIINFHYLFQFLDKNRYKRGPKILAR